MTPQINIWNPIAKWIRDLLLIINDILLDWWGHVLEYAYFFHIIILYCSTMQKKINIIIAPSHEHLQTMTVSKYYNLLQQIKAFIGDPHLYNNKSWIVMQPQLMHGWKSIFVIPSSFIFYFHNKLARSYIINIF